MKQYLSNDQVRVEIAPLYGCAIKSVSGPGLLECVNTNDLGRFIQLDPYRNPKDLPGKPPYNPWFDNVNEAGDVNGNATWWTTFTNDGTTIYTRNPFPLQWAQNDVIGNVLIEKWITLNGPAVEVHGRFTCNYPDHNTYPAHGQELPAGHFCGSLYRLFTYTGHFPWQNDTVNEVPLTPTHQHIYPSEPWCALTTDPAAVGVGIVNYDAQWFLAGSPGVPNTNGPTDQVCTYLAPIQEVAFAWNQVFDLHFAVVVGTVAQVRSYAYANRNRAKPKPPTAPPAPATPIPQLAAVLQ